MSAILATAATCMPQLQALDFSTHYISDAECAAISLMTGEESSATSIQPALAVNQQWLVS
jgi:hypothetical protein